MKKVALVTGSSRGIGRAAAYLIHGLLDDVEPRRADF